MHNSLRLSTGLVHTTGPGEEGFDLPSCLLSWVMLWCLPAEGTLPSGWLCSPESGKTCFGWCGRRGGKAMEAARAMEGRKLS